MVENTYKKLIQNYIKKLVAVQVNKRYSTKYYIKIMCFCVLYDCLFSHEYKLKALISVILVLT